MRQGPLPSVIKNRFPLNIVKLLVEKRFVSIHFIVIQLCPLFSTVVVVLVVTILLIALVLWCRHEMRRQALEGDGPRNVGGSSSKHQEHD